MFPSFQETGIIATFFNDCWVNREAIAKAVAMFQKVACMLSVPVDLFTSNFKRRFLRSLSV